MFSSESDNYDMLFGAYKKIKAYYHYNKNFLFMREKIASFEYDELEMDKKLKYLAKVLKNPSRYMSELKSLIEKVDFYVLPKTLKEDKSVDSRFVSSSLASKSVTKVNFFINMPLELHLLEIVWTLFVAKIAYDNKIPHESSYGNAIANNVLFDSSAEGLKDSIRFNKNNLFKIYFPQYCAWKNQAIDVIDRNKKDKNTVLVSLDIKGFYYSVIWKFEMLEKIIPDNRLKDICQLTRIVKMIFERYTEVLRDIRELSQDAKKKETVLPIGLFSSMLIANIYMHKFDDEISNSKSVLYYGRYVDDILLLLNVDRNAFSADDEGLEKLLVSDNKVLGKFDANTYNLYGYNNLLIQKDKLKVIYFECGKSEGLISQLKKTKLIPSQMNIIPSSDIQMTDFEEAAYALHNFTTETKIRDLGQLEIDKFNLSAHMAELVRASRFRTSHMASTAEKIQRQNEKEKVIDFFAGSNAIEFNSNWLNALYFIMLSSSNKRKDWNLLEDNIRDAIRTVKIDHLEDIHKGKTAKSRMIKDMYHLFDICVATALAINPKFSKKERKKRNFGIVLQNSKC